MCRQNGMAADQHEGAGRQCDRFVARRLIGDAAREGDFVRDLQTLRFDEDVDMRRRWLHVVDTQIERRKRHDRLERGRHGDAAALVQHGRDDPAMDDARIRIANEMGRVRQPCPALAHAQFQDFPAQRDDERRAAHPGCSEGVGGIFAHTLRDGLWSGVLSTPAKN
jgi:hypothetical protein